MYLFVHGEIPVVTVVYMMTTMCLLVSCFKGSMFANGYNGYNLQVSSSSYSALYLDLSIYRLNTNQVTMC